MTEELDRLCQAVAGASCVLILPHNDPDPDAIASALALRFLLAQEAQVISQIVYRGIIGRAENRELVRYLGNPLAPLSDADLAGGGPIALVDTQPGAGNNSFRADRAATVVLDHHPLRAETALAAFADVRSDVGATSTMLLGYLQAAGLEPPTPVATALFYGIRADTLGLSRGATAADVAAYFTLQPRIDVQALVEIERAQVPPAYFRSIDAALRAVRVYDDIVIAYLGKLEYPDLAAEMADLLLRLHGSQWVICMGAFRQTFIISVRTRRRRMRAEQLVLAVVGGEGTAGGHGVMAGGQIPLGSRRPDDVADEIQRRVLRLLEVPEGAAGEALV